MEIKDSMWHAITRAVSVIAVLAVLAGPYMIGRQQGKTLGYSLCMKERPTYTIEQGGVAQVFQGELRPFFVGFKILKVGIGVIWERGK